MKKFLHKVLYYPLWAVWYTMSLLPLRVHYIIGDIFYILVAHVVKYRRKVIMKNLRNSFPEKSEQECKKIMMDYYHFFCDYIAETLKFGTMSRASIKRHIVIKGTGEIAKILNDGQSIAIFMGHYGNWEWVTGMMLWFEKTNCPVSYGHIYHPLENEAMDRLFLSFRNRLGSTSVPMRDTLRWIITNKREGRPTVLGYIADQVPLWQNIHHWLTFFHQETPVFTGVERIAKSQNQAVVYLDMKCVKRGYYECELQVITRDPASWGENEITNECFRRLEKTIMRAPQYWLWSHNRWKRTREEFDRNYKIVNGRVVEK